jgi:hypothetical protein
MKCRFTLLMVAMFGVAVALTSALVACSSSSTSQTSCTAAAPEAAGDGGLLPFTPPDVSKVGAGQLLLTASGETLAQTGYNFPDMPANGVFADGWEVRFNHFIAIFDHVTVSNNPDKVPTDQSQTDNAVAQANGPWIIDLSKSTANDVPGKEGSGQTATPFAVIANQNLCGNQPFDTANGTKYAVGFSAVAASAALSPINVNLDAEGQQIYAEMLAGGCAVLYDGTATFKADPTQCTTQDPEFARFPPVVHFHLCFKSPTTYSNCDNQDIQGTPFGNEPHPRGIVFPNNTHVTGEITFHTDHPFWESVVHDTPAHFDQFAARIALPDGGTPDGGETVTMDSLVGANHLAYTDQFGNPVQWRSCVNDARGMPFGLHSGRMSFVTNGVPGPVVSPTPTTAGLRDYYDYSTYNQSTQGHWNGTDGLCSVHRNYPSPP